MSMSIGLGVGFGAYLPSDSGHAASVSITGLTGGRAIPDQSGAIGAVMSDVSEIETFAWGLVPDGTEFGTDPAPSDFTVGLGGVLYLTVTTGEGVARAQAVIADAAPVVVGTVPAVDWTVGTGITPLDLSGVVSGARLVFGGAVFPGTSLNSSTGILTGTPTLEGVVSRVFTARNSGGVVEISLSGAVSPVAPALGAPVPAQSLAEDVAMTPLNLNDHVTGSNLAFAVTGGSLPAGLGITGGVIAGTPTIVQTAQEVVFTVSNGGGPAVMRVEFVVAAAGVAPRIVQNMSLDDATDTWGLSSDQTGGMLHWAQLDIGAALPSANGAGGWTGSVLESGTASYTGGPLDITAGGISGTRYQLAVYHRNNSLDSNVLATLYTTDNIAPNVTIPTLGAGNGTANVTAVTDEGDGTLFWRVSLASAPVPAAAEVKAGMSRAVVATGSQALITLSGLTNGTQYRVSFLHRDAHRNDSAVVSRSFTPTTGASNSVTPVVVGFTINDVASVPDITATAIDDGFLIEDI